MLVVLALIAIDIYILMNTGSKTEKKDNKESNVEWTVYGTNWCGWTKKQLAYLEKKGISHKYVDCEKNKGLCKNISGFPVMKNSKGEEIVGYKEI
mgnify:CR=1 FL=1|tara:strand:+ start:2949 stop:3233 length:285 start_codon:yes stop_codon:yes gene_type:complete